MNDNELYHHGVKGQKWGIWNAETTARYAGRVGGVVRKGVKFSAKVSDEAKRKIASAYKDKREKDQLIRAAKRADKEKAKQEKAEAIAAAKKEREQQIAFDKQTRKDYHLTAKQYNKLKSETLKSNDPSVVEKGMYLLSDKELETKIQRLNRENEIRKLSLAKKKGEAAIVKEKNEAWQKTLRYQITKNVADTAVSVAKDQITKQGSSFLKDLLSSDSSSSNKQNKTDNQNKNGETKPKTKRQEKQENKRVEKERKQEFVNIEKETKQKAIEDMLAREQEILSNPNHFSDEEYYRLKRRRF